MKVISAMVLALLAPEVLAHTGHGGDVGVVHDMEHALWLLCGIAVALAGYARIKTGRWPWWKE